MPASRFWRRLRRRVNRRFYRFLFAFYRAVFPTPPWPGAVAAAALRRVLVIQHYGVGDMILTTPLLAWLKDCAPHAEIDVLASPRNEAVVSGHPAVRRVYVHDHTWRGWLRVLLQLRARGYDVVFAGQVGKGLREGLTASLASRGRTYKVSLWRPKRYHGLFTAIVRTPRHVTHTADRLLYMGQRALGAVAGPATTARYPPRIAADRGGEAVAAAFIDTLGSDRYVVVNVSAHFAVRDWAPESCARFLALLLERHTDLAAVLTRPPGKAEAAEAVASRCASPRVVVAPSMPLLAVAALVHRARAVVTTETSLIHIASACGRPVVALYAPVVASDVAPWLPVGVPYRALAAPLRGSVADIPPGRVADAFDELHAEVYGRRAGAATPAPTAY